MPVANELDNNKVEVFYPVSEACQVITRAEYDLIKDSNSGQVVLIKFVRTQYALSLMEAKRIVDTIKGTSLTKNTW